MMLEREACSTQTIKVSLDAKHKRRHRPPGAFEDVFIPPLPYGPTDRSEHRAPRC